MRLHRFIGDFDFSTKEVEIQKLENIKQIKGVLRLKVGDHLVLYNGSGNQGEFKISQIEKSKITCELLNILPENKPERKVRLYLAILKKTNFELAVQKAVECGVSEIIPVLNERTIKTKISISRLKKVIHEASEQCGRTDVPVLKEKMKWKDALEIAKHSDETIIFDEDGKEYTPKKGAITVSIFIGPEGGYTENEIALAKAKDFEQTSLGPLVLRGETAAIIATYRAVQGI